MNSNTTLVKVKLNIGVLKYILISYSNTTLVKVKYRSICYFFI